jgi:CBS domain-containing protein
MTRIEPFTLRPAVRMNRLSSKPCASRRIVCFCGFALSHGEERCRVCGDAAQTVRFVAPRAVPPDEYRLEHPMHDRVRMLCQEIMHRRVCSVRETDDVALVARTMRDENVGFVPVLDSDDGVVGVVTDRDIVVRGCVGAVDPRTLLVSSVMSRDLISCRPTEPVENAERKMRERRITRIAVIDSDGTLVGVLSLSDIAQYDSPGRVGRTLQAIAERKYAF